MLKNLSDKEKYQALLDSLLFFKFDKPSLKKISQLTHEKKYHRGETIIKEGDLFDSIFIIVEGEAKIIEKNPNKESTPVAIFKKNDCIGMDLKDPHFFSYSGIRHATIIAATDILLLEIHIKDLINHFKSIDPENTKMNEMTEWLLKINFIKHESFLFSSLNNEEVANIANKITKINIPANQIIFHQGEKADCCYLIKSGEVGIYIHEGDNEEKKISALTSPSIFGEAGLLTIGYRNATVKTITACELFVLHENAFYNLIRKNENFTQSIMALMVNYFKPTQSPDIQSYRHKNNDSQMVITLENIKNGRYFHLSKESYFIWRKLDGEHTIKDLTISFFKRFNEFAPDKICNLLYKMSELGFVIIPAINKKVTDISHRNKWQRIKHALSVVLEKEFSITNLYLWLRFFYRKGIYLIYTWPVRILIFLMIAMGMVSLVGSYSTIMTIAQSSNLNFLFVLFMILAANAITVFLHELAHAFTAVHVGHKVHRMGIGWFLFMPTAFADTSELWLASRSKKLVVDRAGIYMDIFCASGFSLLAAFLIPQQIAVTLWLISLFTYYHAIKNLSPFREFDGYFILVDILEKSNLRSSALTWASNYFLNPQNGTNSKLDFNKNKKEIYYWLSCIIYLITSSLFLFFLLYSFFMAFSLTSIYNIPIYVICIIIPLLLFIIAALSVALSIRNHTLLLSTVQSRSE